LESGFEFMTHGVPATTYYEDYSGAKEL